MIRVIRTGLFLFGALAASATLAQSQPWPSKPVRIIVGYPPGGSADRMARVLAIPLSKELGQPVVVENRPGASGITASEYVLAASDGHTIFLHTTGGTSVRPHTAKLRYNPSKDFIPVTTISIVPTVFVGSTKLPATTLSSLIAYAKANPGKLNFAIPASGTTNHLFGAMLKKQAGIDGVDVPYAGAAPAMLGVMSGDADIMNIDITNVVAMVQSKKLVAYAIASAKRSPFLPDVPTTTEVGFPGLVGNNTWGLYVAASMPARVVMKLRAATSISLHDHQLRESFSASSMVPQESTTQELTQLTKEEEARLEPLIRELHIRLE